MKDSIFIKLLEYGAKKGIEGTSYDEIKSWATERNFIDVTDDVDGRAKELEQLFSETYQQVVRDTDVTHTLKTEYYFRLIEYQELQASRQAAREANRNAFIAIGISLFAIIISAVLTFAQLRMPTTISKSDLSALIRSNTEAGTQQREVKLDKLQMAQILSAIGFDKTNTNAKKEEATNQGHEASHLELINQYFEDQ